jgi:hypothetical protein
MFGRLLPSLAFFGVAAVLFGYEQNGVATLLCLFSWVPFSSSFRCALRFLYNRSKKFWESLQKSKKIS